MMNKKLNKFRPLVGYFTMLGTIVVALSVMAFLLLVEIEIYEERIVWACIAFFLFIVGVSLIILSVLYWDAPVYINDNAVIQKRGKRTTCIQYEEIRKVQLRYCYCHMGYLLKVHSDDGKITMRLFKCFECFMSHCTNTDIVKTIKKLMDDKNIIHQ